MSLPHVTKQQINAMQSKAEEMMRRDGIMPEEPVVPGQTSIMNPMLAHHEEPVHFQEEVEQYDVEESDVEEHEDQVLEEPIVVSASNGSNVRDLRKAKEKAERERDDMMRQILSYQQQQQKSLAPKQEEVDEDPFNSLGLDDDSLVEGKHFREMAKEIKNLKKALQGQQQESSRTSQDALDLKLRSQHPDIDKVLTPENIELFREMDPDLAETIGNNRDVYKKATMAYNMIKRYGIYKEDSFVQERALAQKNSVKPKPLASVSPQQGESPMSKANAFANGLTPDLKKQLHKEMIEAMKGR